ncbi:MAG: hypothetical protein FJX76_17675 [Armatimonadetes bacterium]|nr:hypothetical protein [Armatimonadota bacterium]
MNERPAIFMNRIMLDLVMNPWYDRILSFAFVLLTAGVFIIWVYKRLNDSPIYGMLGYLLAGNGLFMALFLRDPYPNALWMIVETVLAYYTLIYLSALITTLGLRLLPEWGLPERLLFDADDHSIKPYVVPVVSVTLFVLLYIFLYGGWVVLWRIVGGDDLFAIFVALISIPLVALVAREQIPYVQTRETAFLGESAPPCELANLLEITGEASSGEKIAVPIVCFAAGAMLTFLVAEKTRDSGQHFTGLVVLILIAVSIARTEINRAKRAAPRVDAPKKEAAGA